MKILSRFHRGRHRVETNQLRVSDIKERINRDYFGEYDPDGPPWQLTSDKQYYMFTGTITVPEEPDCTDDYDRQWEWGGGQPGTWAWRVTANAPGMIQPCKCTPESCRKDCAACAIHGVVTGRGCIAKITGYPGETADD